MVDHNELIKQRAKRINAQEVEAQRNAFRNAVASETAWERQLREGRKNIVDRRLKTRLGELAYLSEGEQQKQQALVERIRQRQAAQGRERLGGVPVDLAQMREMGNEYHEIKTAEKRNKSIHNPFSRLYKKKNLKQACEAETDHFFELEERADAVLDARENAVFRNQLSADEVTALRDIAMVDGKEENLEKKTLSVIKTYCGQQVTEGEGALDDERQKELNRLRRKELLDSLTDKISAYDLSKIDLSSDSAIIKNQRFLQKMERNVEGFRTLMNYNTDYWDALPQETRNQLDEKVKKLTLISDYADARFRIIKNTYYSTHYNQEISVYATEESSHEQKELSALLVKSFHYAKKLSAAGFANFPQMQMELNLQNTPQQVRDQAELVERYQPKSISEEVNKAKQNKADQVRGRSQETLAEIRRSRQRLKDSKPKAWWDRFYAVPQGQKVLTFADLKKLGTREAQENLERNINRREMEDASQTKRQELEQKIINALPDLRIGQDEVQNQERSVFINGVAIPRFKNIFIGNVDLGGTMTDEEIVTMFKNLRGEKAHGYDATNPQMRKETAKKFDEGVHMVKACFLRSYRILSKRYGTMLSQMHPEDALSMVDYDFFRGTQCAQDVDLFIEQADQYMDMNNPEDVELLHLHRYYNYLSRFLSQKIGLPMKLNAGDPADDDARGFWKKIKEEEAFIASNYDGLPRMTVEQEAQYRSSAQQRLPKKERNAPEVPLGNVSRMNEAQKKAYRASLVESFDKITTEESRKVEIEDSRRKHQATRTKEQWDAFYAPPQGFVSLSYEDIRNLSAPQLEQVRDGQTNFQRVVRENDPEDLHYVNAINTVNGMQDQTKSGVFNCAERGIDVHEGFYLVRIKSWFAIPGMDIAAGKTDAEVKRLFQNLIGPNMLKDEEKLHTKKSRETAKKFDEGVLELKDLYHRQYKLAARRYGILLSQMHPEDALALMDNEFMNRMNITQDMDQMIRNYKDYFDEKDPQDAELIHLHRYFHNLSAVLIGYRSFRTNPENAADPAMIDAQSEFYAAVKEEEKFIEGPRMRSDQLEEYRKNTKNRMKNRPREQRGIYTSYNRMMTNALNNNEQGRGRQ